MASPSARVRLICCFHLCAILLWIFMVHSDQMILPEGERLDSWDCFTHGILSCWKSTAAAALSVVWRAYVLFLPTVASDYWWALVFFCLVWGLPGVHYCLIFSLPAGCVALSSCNLGPLPDCLALPLDQLIAWQWLPTALSICWPACIASLLSFQSDCTWALASGCPVSCSRCLALPSCWVHLLTLWNCSSAAWHTCWLFGTALATCWMLGIFLMPFHLILEYSVPLLLFESAYSLILALLPFCPLAFMPGVSIISSYPSA